MESPTVALLLSLTLAGAWPPASASSRGGEVSSEWRLGLSPPGRPGKAQEGPFRPFQGSLGPKESSVQLCPCHFSALGAKTHRLRAGPVPRTGLGPVGRPQDRGTLGLCQATVTPLSWRDFLQGAGNGSDLILNERVPHLEPPMVCKESFPEEALAPSLRRRPGAMSLASHPSLAGNSSPEAGALGKAA